MFARTVQFHLKANSVAEFYKTIDNEIIPLLRKQMVCMSALLVATQQSVPASTFGRSDSQRLPCFSIPWCL